MIRSIALMLASFAVACGGQEATPPDAGTTPTPQPVPVGELRGQVVVADASGTKSPAPFLALSLEPGDRAVQTDGDGRFSVTGLASGRYLLRGELDVDADGRTDTGFHRRGIVLGATAGVDLGELVAAGLGDVEGRVVREGVAQAGAFVVLTREGAARPAERMLASDAAGAFRFRGLVPGSYTLRALLLGNPASGSALDVEVPANAIGRADVVLAALPAQEATVHGTATGGGDAGLEITLVSADGATSEPVVSGGAFAMRVANGLYTAQATTTAPDAVPQTVPGLLVFGDLDLGPLVVPTVPASERDLDGDGVVALSDPDDDGDGCTDADEPPATRADPLSCADLDADGLGDGIDPDDDGDAVADLLDGCATRHDPPGLTPPVGCAPYPALVAWLEAPSSVRVDEGFLAQLHVEGGVGDASVELSFAGPEGALGTAFERDAGSWQLEAALPGTWTVRATVRDAVNERVVESVVVVEAPPIAVVVVPPSAVDVSTELALEAVLHEPLTGAVFEWQEIDGDLVDLVAGADTPEVTLFAREGGTARLVVRVTKGTRSGEATVELVVRAPPLPVTLPARVETSVGDALSVTAQLGEELSDVSWTWTGDASLVVTGEGATVQVVPQSPGDHVLRVAARTGSRAGEAGTVVRAHPIGVVSLDGVAGQSVGTTRTYTVSIAPVMRGPSVTYALREGGPAGAELVPAGTSFDFRATALGTWLVDVEAREGGRVARGTVSIAVDSEPLAVAVTRTPQPIAYVGREVVLSAASAELVDPAAASWLWTARANNPSQPALAGAATHELRFVPDTPGTYRFDLVVRAGARGAAVPVEVVVEARSSLGVSCWWYGNRVGQLLQLDAEIAESFADQEWTFTQDPGNPAQLTLRRPGSARATASVTVPGLYRFTASVRAGGRTGSRTVEVLVLDAADPRPALTVYPSRATSVVGDTLELWLDSSEAVDLESAEWTQDPANPAQLEVLTASTPWWRELQTTEPGDYRFSVTATTVAGETMSVSVVVSVVAPVPVEAGVTSAVAGGPIRLWASADTPEPVTLFWSVREKPASAPNTRLDDSQSATPATLQAAVAGTYRFRVTASTASSSGTAEVVVEVAPAAGPVSFDFPSTVRGAVGRPVKLHVVQRNAIEPTIAWLQDTRDPVLVEASGADTAELSFVPAQVGTYRFDVNARDFAGNARSGTVTVLVEQVLPELRIDGHAALPPLPVLTSAQRVWLCDSSRADVVSYEWERVSGALDGEVVIDGPWISFRIASDAHPLSAWRCTARTASGASLSMVRPLVVAPTSTTATFDDVRFARLSSDPLPDCTRRPLPAGCTGAFDDPFPTFARAVADTPAFIVAFAGEETFSGPLATGGLLMFGGVDPATFEQAPARRPSVLRFVNVDTTGVLLPSSGGRIDGFEVHVTPKSGSTNPVVVVEALNAAIVTRNSIEVVAGTQAVTAVRTPTTWNPALTQITQNRVRVVGGSGTGAIVDRCRGSLVAHNFVEVDATSTLGAGVRVDCSGTHTRRPMLVANNAVFMGNASPGYAVDGAPATDAGHRFAGNWFSGSGPFVTAALLSPARSLSDPAAINAGFAAGGFDGGGNSTDAACFSPAATDPWAGGVNPASSCVGAAVLPKPATTTTPALLSLSSDVDGTTRNLATGWAAPDGAGTIDVGPDEL